MAERKKNPKAEAAMSVSLAYKEADRYLALARAKLWEAKELAKAEGASTASLVGNEAIQAHIEVSSYDIGAQQTFWHNLAYDRGYFETVDVARKMSKTKIDR